MQADGVKEKIDERLLAAYEDYCAKLTAYGETLFAETFAFYDTLTEEKPE